VVEVEVTSLVGILVQGLMHGKYSVVVVEIVGVEVVVVNKVAVEVLVTITGCTERKLVQNDSALFNLTSPIAMTTSNALQNSNPCVSCDENLIYLALGFQDDAGLRRRLKP